MKTIGLFEAKNRLSELVERASHGERIGITRHGKLAALIVPARPEESLEGSSTIWARSANGPSYQRA